LALQAGEQVQARSEIPDRTHRAIIYFMVAENFEGSLHTRQPASMSCKACFFSVNPAMANPMPKSSHDIIFPK
jgi:hypothetical protein